MTTYRKRAEVAAKDDLREAAQPQTYNTQDGATRGIGEPVSASYVGDTHPSLRIPEGVLLPNAAGQILSVDGTPVADSDSIDDVIIGTRGSRGNERDMQQLEAFVGNTYGMHIVADPNSGDDTYGVSKDDLLTRYRPK